MTMMMVICKEGYVIVIRHNDNACTTHPMSVNGNYLFRLGTFSAVLEQITSCMHMCN